MITYVTDQRPGEPDILTPHRFATLVIRDLQGAVLHTANAPENGWTHEMLCTVQPPEISEGAEAYLSEQWIGSTEA
ncbi:hypothetical protein [Enterobacter sp.]|uniref:hypothetical protein n=1 Tax=Enterobacter sp. TaxID=42895 RepID=UPI00296E64D2|nr:hypothetical protein [Enterobacter sp.]